jgi:hypothetical protein
MFPRSSHCVYYANTNVQIHGALQIPKFYPNGVQVEMVVRDWWDAVATPPPGCFPTIAGRAVRWDPRQGWVSFDPPTQSSRAGAAANYYHDMVQFRPEINKVVPPDQFNILTMVAKEYPSDIEILGQAALAGALSFALGSPVGT